MANCKWASKFQTPFLHLFEIPAILYTSQSGLVIYLAHASFLALLKCSSLADFWGVAHAAIVDRAGDLKSHY